MKIRKLTMNEKGFCDFLLTPETELESAILNSLAVSYMFEEIQKLEDTINKLKEEKND